MEYNYIEFLDRVIGSCRTKEQRENAVKWAEKIINKLVTYGIEFIELK